MDVRRHARIAERAQVDAREILAPRRECVVVERRAVAQVAVRAEIEGHELEVGRECLEHAHALGDDLRSDAVPGDDRNPAGHRLSPSRESGPAGRTSTRRRAVELLELPLPERDWYAAVTCGWFVIRERQSNSNVTALRADEREPRVRVSTGSRIGIAVRERGLGARAVGRGHALHSLVVTSLIILADRTPSPLPDPGTTVLSILSNVRFQPPCSAAHDRPSSPSRVVADPGIAGVVDRG
jgi:hypothetical protein